jgi:hypothetical protein
MKSQKSKIKLKIKSQKSEIKLKIKNKIKNQKYN